MNTNETSEGPCIRRRPYVRKFSGYGDTQLNQAIKRGEFPAPIKLSETGRAVGWLDEELVAWREGRKAARDGAK